MHVSRFSILAAAFMAVFLFSGCSTPEKRKANEVTPAEVKKVEPVKQAPVKPKLSDKDRMMRVALKMRGKPYSYKGASPKGFDASGLVYYCHKQVGLDVPRSFKEQLNKSKPIARDKLRPGDLVFFALGTNKPNHVGIYLGAKKFIHSPASHNQVIMSGIKDKKWAEALVRGGRL
jgi:cell wall-associated NlpC family hydrolase